MRPFAICLLLTLAFSASLRADDADKEFKKLHGTWVVVAAEQNGQPLDRLKDGKLTIKDQNFAIVTASGFEMKGDLRLDPAKKPKTMDLAHQDGVLRDKVWQAIYQIDGDELKICYAEADSGKDRPKDFKTEADSGLLLVILKKQEK